MKKKYSKRRKGFESDTWKTSAEEIPYDRGARGKPEQPGQVAPGALRGGRALLPWGNSPHVGGRQTPVGRWPLHIPPTPMERTTPLPLGGLH